MYMNNQTDVYLYIYIYMYNIHTHQSTTQTIWVCLQPWPPISGTLSAENPHQP